MLRIWLYQDKYLELSTRYHCEWWAEHFEKATTPDELHAVGETIADVERNELVRERLHTLYRERLRGALLGRFAGCTLGAPVEFWSIERMRSWAAEIDHPFPPTSYWPRIPDPHVLRYSTSRRDAYTAEHMHGVPVDDDIAYTLLGLLILEDYGPEFTTEQVAQAWLRYLPYACTAEEAALDNLRAGVPANKAAEKNNPYRQWIGAAIRADAWGYTAAGWPEKAATLAWRDGVLSHRRNGVYAEMYFAAAIAARSIGCTSNSLSSGPYISRTLPLGTPPIPSAMSRARDPVEMDGMSRIFSSPIFIIEPRPNCFSI